MSVKLSVNAAIFPTTIFVIIMWLLFGWLAGVLSIIFPIIIGIVQQKDVWYDLYTSKR